MGNKQVRHSPGFPTLAAVLIVAGVLLLLRNLDALPPGMWRAATRFWPIILVIFGVNIFLREKPRLAGFIVLLLLLASIGAAWWLAHNYPGSFTVRLG